MLHKKYRLPKKDIPMVVRKGKRLPVDGIDLKVWYDDNLANALFCFIVSKKIDKRATVRNRIKRVLRAQVYEMIKKNAFRKGKYVFVVKQNLERFNLSNA